MERLKQLRAAFREEALACAELALARLPLDEVADDLAVQFLKQRLPPVVPAGARCRARKAAAGERQGGCVEWEDGVCAAACAGVQLRAFVCGGDGAGWVERWLAVGAAAAQ